MWFGKLGIGLVSVLLLVAFPMATGFETAEAEAGDEVVVEQVDSYNGRDQIPATQYASLEAIPGTPYEVPEEGKRRKAVHGLSNHHRPHNVSVGPPAGGCDRRIWVPAVR